MCFKTQMTALESVLNASIQIEDNRKSKKKYSFRFNNNQVCKHVELHRSSLPVNFRFFRCGLIKRRCESDPICHGLSVILYKLPDIKVFYWFPAISAQELKLSCIFLPWFFFHFERYFLHIWSVLLMLRFVQSAFFELLKKIVKNACLPLWKEKKSCRKRMMF